MHKHGVKYVTKNKAASREAALSLRTDVDNVCQVTAKRDIRTEPSNRNVYFISTIFFSAAKPLTLSLYRYTPDGRFAALKFIV